MSRVTPPPLSYAFVVFIRMLHTNTTAYPKIDHDLLSLLSLTPDYLTLYRSCLRVAACREVTDTFILQEHKILTHQHSIISFLVTGLYHWDKISCTRCDMPAIALLPTHVNQAVQLDLQYDKSVRFSFNTVSKMSTDWNTSSFCLK